MYFSIVQLIASQTAGRLIIPAIGTRNTLIIGIIIFSISPITFGLSNSKTLFLLEKGEVVSIQRITPSEFKVSIEVKLDNSKVVIMEGWVLRSDLVLLNSKDIFKKES